MCVWCCWKDLDEKNLMEFTWIQYETSVKKQAVTAAFAPVAAAVVCSSPVVVAQRRREQSNGDERDDRDEGLRRGRQVCGRSSQQAR